MKTNLYTGYTIEGFDDNESLYSFKDAICIVGEELPYIYLGKTSEIPKEIALKCFELQQIFNTPEYLAINIDRFRNYQVTDYAWFDCTLDQSIYSACNQPYCIIYKQLSHEDN